MEDADTVGVHNVVDFTPPIEEYNLNRASVEEFAQNSFYQLMKDGTGNISRLINDLNNLKGGNKATDAINSWYNNAK